MRAVRSIAIVGAGWSGLQIGKVLRDSGFEVSIIEELDDVGGTWHPDRAYHGLSIHTPIFRCQFHGVDEAAGQSDEARLQRLPSRDLFEKCRAFAKRFDLYEVTTFRQRVTALQYDSGEGTCSLTLRSLEDGSESRRDYDFVVSTQFNAPRMPQLKNRALFSGAVLHSNDVKSAVVDDIVKNKRRVVLLGGSKASADLALALLEKNHDFIWLMRAMYWFLNYDKAYFDHKTKKPAALIYRLLYVLGMRLTSIQATMRFGFWLWRRFGLLHTPGEAHLDLRRFHHGWLDEHQVEQLRTRTDPVYGEIAALEAEHVRLKDGRRLACDVLICATGCDPIAVPIALSVDGQALRYDEVRALYRHSVIPQIPRLCFTGFFNFGFGPLNGYHRAGWIMKYLEQRLTSERLREIAEREATPGTPPFQSPIFDSSNHLLLRGGKQLLVMLDSPRASWDLAEYTTNYAVRYELKPFRTLDEYIRSRLKPNAATLSSRAAQDSAESGSPQVTP